MLRSIDFKDAIEASKHNVNKQQTSRFGVIILIYDKNRFQNSRENCSQTYKQPINI